VSTKSQILISSIVVLNLQVGCNRSETNQSNAVSQENTGARPTNAQISAVKPLSSIESMGELMRLTRFVTYKHMKVTANIVLHFRAESQVIDDSGNVFDMSPLAWRGIVALIKSKSPNPVPMLTPRMSLLTISVTFHGWYTTFEAPETTA
jgi:hypothetical protein